MTSRSKAQRHCFRWWDWMLIIVGLPALALILWLLRRRAKTEPAPDIRIEITAAPHPAEVVVPVVAAAPSTPDNLQRVEGIGPKISNLLQRAGIATFAQLAAADVDQLRRILRAGGVRIADPTTWPEQASLAAAGQWETLEALQATLKGGRRVEG